MGDLAHLDAARSRHPDRLVIGIASSGRAAILARTLDHLARQHRRPDLVILSIGTPSDVSGIDPDALPFDTRIIAGPRGLTRQRNRVLDACAPGDLLIFLDDDFLPAEDIGAAAMQLFADHPDIVAATGEVIADGVSGPGHDHDTGLRLLAEGRARQAEPMRDWSAVYGCNFALRAGPVLAEGLRFDERLPLYGWLEDIDFSAGLGRLGRIVKTGALRGVHLGTKSGRTPGRALGYSQIANPLYMRRKGTITFRRAWTLMSRNLASNLWHSLRPVPWTDHRGRLAGNLAAWRDAIANCDQPEHVLTLGASRAAAPLGAAPASAE